MFKFPDHWAVDFLFRESQRPPPATYILGTTKPNLVLIRNYSDSVSRLNFSPLERARMDCSLSAKSAITSSSI